MASAFDLPWLVPAAAGSPRSTGYQTGDGDGASLGAGAPVLGRMDRIVRRPMNGRTSGAIARAMRHAAPGGPPSPSIVLVVSRRDAWAAMVMARTLSPAARALWNRPRRGFPPENPVPRPTRSVRRLRPVAAEQGRAGRRRSPR